MRSKMPQGIYELFFPTWQREIPKRFRCGNLLGSSDSNISAIFKIASIRGALDVAPYKSTALAS